MTPKEKQALLQSQIEELSKKIDKILKLLGDKDAKSTKKRQSK